MGFAELAAAPGEASKLSDTSVADQDEKRLTEAMNDTTPETLTVLPNPALFRAARVMQRVGLGIAGLGILFGLMPLAGLRSSQTAAMARGAFPLLLTAIINAVGLQLLAMGRERVALLYAQRAANVMVLLAAAVVVFWSRAAGVGARSGDIVFPPPRLAFGFVALALAVVLMERKNWLLNRLADVLVCCLCLMSLTFVADLVFMGRQTDLGGFGAASVCLMSLTAVVTLRQAEHGVFSIFLGVGIGSRLARIFAPILILVPFAWHSASHHLTGRANGALLASAGVAAAFGVLLFFAWRISQMENQIHDLVMRDESTRLYNQRGFQLLAEHALRLAKRSSVPFSILFISLENLAHIHAQLGPDSASASLSEAGEILRATFRESDIKGRIGAAEFAVAGRFDRTGILVAALRLEAATAARNAKSERPIPLRFSMGHVTTTDPEAQETLKDLLARAGHAKNRMDQQLTALEVN